MVRVNNGYLFEARSDASGKIGVNGSFKAIKRGDKVHITFTAGINTNVKMCVPSVGDLSNGFVELSKVCTSDEELQAWVASNRSYYYRVGSFGVMADGTAIVHADGTVDMSKVALYVPASFVENCQSFDSKPAIFMLRLSEKPGMGIQTVSSTFLKGYMNYLSEYLSSVDTSSKFIFLRSLLKSAIVGGAVAE